MKSNRLLQGGLGQTAGKVGEAHKGNRSISRFFVFVLAAPLVALGQPDYANPYTFATLAGTASVAGTNNGSGGVARFDYPDGLALDNSGNLYIVDQFNFTIRRMTPFGVVTTLAGQPGVAGSADGTNNAALFNHPWGLARDNAGNLYVSDQGNHTIRKVAPEGTNWVVTTLAGKVGVEGAVDGTNSDALFNEPDGSAVDQVGNLYVADEATETIRKLTLVGTNWVVTTVAGQPGVSGTADGTNNAARFNGPTSVTVTGSGDLFVADVYNDTIRMLSPSGTNWVVTTIAGQAGSPGSADGPNNSARFNEPNGVIGDVLGNLYVADYGDYTIRKIMPVGTNWVTTTVAGGPGTSGSEDGSGGNAQFNHPTFLALDSAGNLYVADRDNDTIRRGFLTGGAPTILPPGLIDSGNLAGFNITAADGQQIVVDASTDLVNWVSIWTNTVGPGPLSFSDSQSDVFLNRFYRVHLP